jgi:hypothetical protein
MKASNRIVRTAFALALAAAPTLASAQTAGCDPSVASAQDTSRLNFISGRAALANQSFSQRPSTMSNMTCLQKLFSFGNQSMDILFQPPSMSSLLSLIQNFACQAMSQYMGQSGASFTSMLGQSFGGLGGGVNSSVAGGGTGQIIPGVNIGSLMSGSLQGVIMQGSGTFNTTQVNPMSLFQTQPGAVSIPGAGTTIGNLYK